MQFQSVYSFSFFLTSIFNTDQGQQKMTHLMACKQFNKDVDGKSGCLYLDQDIQHELRRKGKPLDKKANSF